jgi:hypothetical protein
MADHRPMATLNSRGLRARPAPYVDPIAIRRQALALRGNCRRHGEYRLNVLRNGVVTANACPGRYPQWARR